jgi:hypothetical protein
MHVAATRSWIDGSARDWFAWPSALGQSEVNQAVTVARDAIRRNLSTIP